MIAHTKHYFYTASSGFCWARLGHCFFDFDYYSKNLIEIILPIKKNDHWDYKFVGFSGLASHGGTVGLLISLYLYSKI
jgi:prolipoprotein diacylglyceryltransferase